MQYIIVPWYRTINYILITFVTVIPFHLMTRATTDESSSANGGLGKAFDELELNRVLCEQNNVRIAGVIINKVFPDKYAQTKDYMERAMMQTWGIPLLGCIPDRP